LSNFLGLIVSIDFHTPGFLLSDKPKLLYFFRHLY
jgi:hypothetical protein